MRRAAPCAADPVAYSGLAIDQAHSSESGRVARWRQIRFSDWELLADVSVDSGYATSRVSLWDLRRQALVTHDARSILMS